MTSILYVAERGRPSFQTALVERGCWAFKVAEVIDFSVIGVLRH